MRLKDRVAELCTVTGTTNPYVVSAALSAAHRRWRNAYADGTADLGYVAKTTQRSPNGAKIEIGLTTITYGTLPSVADSLSRPATVIDSSNDGDPVDWSASDIVIIYQAPLLDIYNALLQPDWVDNGAANLAITAAHFGKVIDFNVTAASRTATFAAGAALGRGFQCWVYGYGSTSNGVVLTPASGQRFNEQLANATKTILGGVKAKIEWNDTRSLLIVSTSA